MQKPTIGRIVLYKLAKHDVDGIHAHRENRVRNGNPVSVGDVLPAIVVAVFEDEFGAGVPGVNLQVYLDGGDTYWATSRREGPDGCQWAWPPRA